MTKDQATKAVELLGGYAKAARLIKNLSGEPMLRANLRNAISNKRGVPEWLSNELRWEVAKQQLKINEFLDSLQ